MVFGEYGVNTASILMFVIKLIMFAWGMLSRNTNGETRGRWR